MAADDDEDLYNDEFDFVDDEDEAESEADEVDEADADETLDEPAVAEKRSYDDAQPDVDEESRDEYGRPEPAANFVVHVYEFRKFKRTIDRPFTAEDAEAFASEYNRTAKPYGRFAVAGKDDAKPRKSLD
jgi:hypothetical protein